MSDGRLLACTLTPEDRNDRAGAWRRVLGSGLVERTSIPGGIRLVAQPAAAQALTELVDLERDCCAWINFRVPQPSTFELTSEGEGADALATMFVPPVVA